MRKRPLALCLCLLFYLCPCPSACPGAATPARLCMPLSAPSPAAQEDLPPMRQLQARSAFDDLGVRGYYETKVHTRKKKGRGGRRGDSSDDDAPAVMQVVDLPEGASLSDEEREKRKNKKKSGQSVLMQHTDPNSIDARLNMDLSGPLRADEALPEVKAYLRQEASPKQVPRPCPCATACDRCAGVWMRGLRALGGGGGGGGAVVKPSKKKFFLKKKFFTR